MLAAQGSPVAATDAARPTTRSSTTALGLLALAFWALHASFYVQHGPLENLLWGCLIALPLLGVGLLARLPVLVGPPTLMLVMGTPMWLIDMATGSPPVRGTFATHLGGPIVALLGSRLLGVPRGSCLIATALLITLIGTARLFGTPAENVNVAFAVHPSAAPYIDSHAAYLVLLVGGLGAAFCALEALLRFLGWRCPVCLEVARAARP